MESEGAVPTSALPISVHDLLYRRGVEAARVEFKSGWNEGPTAQQVLETICAFANDYYNVNGGYVILGVEEKDGVAQVPPKGLDPSSLERLQRWIRGNCQRMDPVYQPVLSHEVVEGRHILAIWAHGSFNRPHSLPGERAGDRRFWVRLGPETVEARGAVLTELIQMTRWVPFDDQPAPRFDVYDLRSTLVREFLKEVGSALVDEPDDREMYRAMRLVHRMNGHEAPRNVGLLFFSDDPERHFPGARIDVVRFEDDAGGDVLEERIFRGPLHRQVRDCLGYLRNLVVQFVQKHPDRPEATTWAAYPFAAIEEAIVNAVHHRDYRAEQQTKVYLYPTELVVTSYPGPVPGLKLEDFASGRRLPQVPARNRRIGELLKELKLAETRSTGVSKIFRAMAANGSPEPRFEFDNGRTYFTVVLPIHPEALVTKAPKPPDRPRLPGLPRCFGRTDELRDLVEALLLPSPPPVSILGPPGVGKTTLSLAAIHEPRVKARFGDRRWFVRCDGVKNKDALVTEIALSLGLESGPNLERWLFQALEGGPSVLLLDSAETPWEADTVPVENLLTELSTIPGVVLVASIRGDQRPLGPRWREAIRLGPFGLEAARDTFVAIAGRQFKDDPDLDRLLEAVDRLPIAVALLAYQAEAEPNLATLWKRWQDKRTALLKKADGKERLTNIEFSLDLSLNGPRMTAESKRLLTVLALLPDGVAHEDLDALLPEVGGEAAAVLRKVGLAFDQGTRLRVLAPVREYVSRQHLPEERDLTRTVDHYLKLARQGGIVGRKGGADAVARLVQEFGNLDSMVSKGLERDDPEPAIQAALALGKFFQFSGWGSQEPLQRALSVAQSGGNQKLEANCIQRLGDIALARSDLDAARARYQEALSLYRNVGDVLGEANCIQRLGDIALARSDHDAARARYEEALPLFRNVGDVLGEANCIQRLGDIALARSDLDAARARYEEALPLFRNVGDVLGEADCTQRLGDIAFARSDHDAARACYEEALPLFRNVGDVLGEANCIQRLGDIALARSDLGAARESFKEALRLYERIPEPYSIGWTLVRLARLEPAGSSERRSFVEAARKAWESIKKPDLVVRLKDEFGEDC